jgi:hypothetical protein
MLLQLETKTDYKEGTYLSIWRVGGAHKNLHRPWLGSIVHVEFEEGYMETRKVWSLQEAFRTASLFSTFFLKNFPLERCSANYKVE